MIHIILCTQVQNNIKYVNTINIHSTRHLYTVYALHVTLWICKIIYENYNIIVYCGQRLKRVLYQKTRNISMQ